MECGNYRVSKQKLLVICEHLGLDLSHVNSLLVEEDNKSMRDNLKIHLISIEHILDLISYEVGWEDLSKIQLEKNDSLKSLYEYLKGRCHEEDKNWEQAEICFLD